MKKQAPKIKADPKIISQFLDRGVEAVYPSKEKLRKKLLKKERLRVYQGFDPTGPYLHIGHAIGIRALRLLQQLGHEVIFLVGDYTSKIGDPDKDTTRTILTDEEIQSNMRNWKKQAGELIDFSGENPVKFERNHRWLSRLKMKDLIKLMSQITVQRLTERDLFKRRLKKGDPIRLHEFFYPLMQGYDSVAMKIDLEMGGADQIFNMLVGRDLVKNYLGKEKFVRANKMMDAPDCQTMSKTKGNGINLSDTPQQMFGKAMSYSDQHIIPGLELLTDLPQGKIKEIKQAMEKGQNPMQFKKTMAFEIVRIIKGEKAARLARNYFEKVFSEKQTPNDLPTVKVKNNSEILPVLQKSFKKNGEKISNSELKRLIKQGAVKAREKLIKEINHKLKIPSKGLVIKVGKRNWFKIIKIN
ncbi:MAG: tyrosine--tRNA ligase [Patescibacteria group bacterium]|nr:tyrosine--tRNA ligase [Patescibacteria group bacterium]